jgi:hypothetical protein
MMGDGVAGRARKAAGNKASEGKGNTEGGGSGSAGAAAGVVLRKNGNEEGSVAELELARRRLQLFALGSWYLERQLKDLAHGEVL